MRVRCIALIQQKLPMDHVDSSVPGDPQSVLSVISHAMCRRALSRAELRCARAEPLSRARQSAGPVLAPPLATSCFRCPARWAAGCCDVPRCATVCCDVLRCIAVCCDVSIRG